MFWILWTALAVVAIVMGVVSAFVGGMTYRSLSVTFALAWLFMGGAYVVGLAVANLRESREDRKEGDGG